MLRSTGANVHHRKRCRNGAYSCNAYFLSAYEQALPAENRTETAQQWLQAAKEYVERSDPLNALEQVAKVLEPTDEELERMIAEAKAVETQSDKRSH